MTCKTNIHIVAFTMLLLLGACSVGLSEDEQQVVDACLLNKDLDKKACQCVAKALAKHIPEQDFAKVAVVLRVTSQHSGLEENAERVEGMLVNALGGEVAAAEFMAKMEPLQEKIDNECKK